MSTPTAYYDATKDVVKVFVGSYDDNVYAIDGRTGAKIWAYTTVGNVIASPTTYLLNGQLRVYVGCDNTITEAFMYALDGTTGAVVWSYNLPDSKMKTSNNAAPNEVQITDAGIWSKSKVIEIDGYTIVLNGDQIGNMWCFIA